MAEPGRQHHNITLAVLAASALSYALGQTMVAPALPAIQHSLNASATSATWVLTIFLLTASIATPICGRLGDMFGKERTLLVVLGFYAAGSLICALSHSLGPLIAGRAISGVGGAVFPLAFGIIRDEFPREKVAGGIGLISATFGIGGGAGLVLSGLVVDNLSYEWIFWLSLAIVLVAMVLTHLYVPESPIKSPARIDWAGAGLLSVGLAALLLAVSEGNRWGWGSARELGLLAGSAGVLAVWVRVERRQAEPLVDMQVLSRRAVAATNVTAFLMGFGMFGSFILIPQLVQLPEATGFGFGASVTEAGLFLMPSTAVMLVSGPIAGQIGGRVGSRLPLIVGAAASSLSFAWLAIAHGSKWEIYAATALLGLGIGFALAAMANLIVDAVKQSETGAATGINTIMRSIGGSLGAQVSASIVAAHTAAGGLPADKGFTIAFAVSAAGLVVAFVSSLAVPSQGDRELSLSPA